MNVFIVLFALSMGIVYAQARDVPEKRQAWRGCQSAAGGYCVVAGTCPENLKPEVFEDWVCHFGQECCLGPPPTDRSCGGKGGQCIPRADCMGPIYKGAEDCDQLEGNICCLAKA